LPHIHSFPTRRSSDLAIGMAADIRCPVQFIYPGQDHLTVRSTFVALRDALESRREASIIHVYPDAGHGFFTQADEPGNRYAVARSEEHTSELQSRFDL